MNIGKVQKDKLSKEEKIKIYKNLLEILSKIENKDDLLKIILGSLTESETIMIANRINIAKRVFEKESDRKIKNDIKVGFSTIKTVKAMIRSRGYYYDVLSKYFEKIDFEEHKYDNINTYFRNKLYKYPGYKIAAKILGIDYIDRKINGD